MVFTEHDYQIGEKYFLELIDSIDKLDNKELSTYDLHLSNWMAKFTKELINVDPRWGPWVTRHSQGIRMALRPDFYTSPECIDVSKEYSRLQIINRLLKELLMLAHQIIDGNTPEKKYGQKVFIVHGHDHQLRDEIEQYVNRLGYKTVVLSKQPNHGKTIFDKIYYYSQDVGFAIILLTADDVGSTKGLDQYRPRARQNVILEWGYFGALVGPGRIALIQDEHLDAPGDMNGFVYYTRHNWETNLLKDLQNALGDPN